MSYIGKKPTAAPLTSSDVADDIITLAKMAGGTDGYIITYDASGNPAVVATGTDGQVLTSTGAGSPPAFEAVSGGTTAPYVSVGLSSDQGLSDDSAAKVEFDSEIVDSNGKFASNRFTPTVVGKYFVSCNLTFETDVRLRFREITVYIYKNGSAVIQTFSAPDNNAFEKEGYTQSVSGVVDCDADDYIEIYAKVNTSANTPNVAGGNNLSCLTIFKMTE